MRTVVLGDSVPLISQWSEVYRKINRAGKNIWLQGEIEDIEVIADQIGTTKGIFWSEECHVRESDRVYKILEMFGHCKSLA